MNLDIYEKWNRYMPGDVAFSKPVDKFLYKQKFIDFVVDNKDINSIVEIGPGELIEYQQLIKVKSVDYTIVDVSTTFIENALAKFPTLNCIQCPMESLTFFKHFDLVYCDSVLEHSSHLHLALRNLIKSSKYFYFVLFKWKYDGNNLAKWRFSETRLPYWSTTYNIYFILRVIQLYGIISSVEVYNHTLKQFLNLEDHKKLNPIPNDKDNQRQGHRLIIRGVSNE